MCCECNNGWRDIESAPKGRFVLAYPGPDEDTVEAILYDNGDWRAFGCNGSVSIEPKLWCEKPEPPLASMTGDEG
jgi:hypothetical protein